MITYIVQMNKNIIIYYIYRFYSQKVMAVELTINESDTE